MQTVFCLATAAIEGGINYWGGVGPISKEAKAAGVTYYGEAVAMGFPIEVFDQEDEGKPYFLTLDRFRIGIRKAAEARGKTIRGFFEDHDACDGDAAVQFALFNELVYG